MGSSLLMLLIQGSHTMKPWILFSSRTAWILATFFKETRSRTRGLITPACKSPIKCAKSRCWLDVGESRACTNSSPNRKKTYLAALEIGCPRFINVVGVHLICQSVFVAATEKLVFRSSCPPRQNIFLGFGRSAHKKVVAILVESTEIIVDVCLDIRRRVNDQINLAIQKRHEVVLGKA